MDIATLSDGPAALRDVIAGLPVDLSTERQARAVAEARLRRMQFGRSSERLHEQIAQLELSLRGWRGSQTPGLTRQLRSR